MKKEKEIKEVIDSPQENGDKETTLSMRAVGVVPSENSETMQSSAKVSADNIHSEIESELGKDYSLKEQKGNGGNNYEVE